MIITEKEKADVETDIQVAKEFIGCFLRSKNEKINLNLIIIFFIITFVAGGTIGFFIGSGNLNGLINNKPTNRQLTETVRELREELSREREALSGIRGLLQEERDIIKSALETCRRIGEGIQGTIRKMEILNNLIIDLECRAYGSVDISEIK
jgi:uncharacterized protein YneF (UPF0154 family)